MRKIKIEKGIEIPPKKGRSPITSALCSMKIGDSFIIPSSTRGNVTAFAKKANVKATTRKISNTEVRVWRIK